MKSLSLAVAVAGLLLLASPAVAADPVLDLERLTAGELQTKMAAGQLTSVQATRAYIDRIAAVNARGPGLNAVRIVNPRALQDASLLDLERATGKVRGPLHGIPVLVKDNLDVAGLPTTAGSVALQNSVPDRDSTVVAKLRAAGAVILGKTNLSEFAFFMSIGLGRAATRSLGGQVLNPYDIDLVPERLELWLGVGRRRRPRRDHDRHGDQRLDRHPRPRPRASSACARPIGLVSRAGILPISSHPGHRRPDDPHGRGRRGRTAGHRRARSRGSRHRGRAAAPDYLAGLKTDALAGKRIGVISDTNAQYQSPRSPPCSGSAPSRCRSRATNPPAPYDVLTAEFKRDLNAYLGRLPASAPIKSLADIIAFNTAHADEALKFGQGLLTASQAVDLTDPAQNAAYVSRP